MDEIEYKLDTNNSVLVVNAIDKLISTIKSKFKPTERQRFVLENEELKFLREKCSSKGRLVSLTACQGLLALVELGVLEIGHTMSTVITLLPSAHNYSAIISTMAGLLTLDLRSRLVPGQPYVCQFGLRTLQHPLVTVLEQNKGAEDEVLAQMHALCTHPDYTISSNSIELLRPVFIWLACDSRHSAGARPWQLLLELPRTRAQEDLLLACLSCQQMSDVSCWGAAADAAVYQGRSELVAALLPVLARLSTELLKNGRDPRSVYSLLNRCAGVDAGESRAAAGLTVSLLAENLVHSSALYLHELFNLCLNIICKYEYSSMSLNTFVALSLQWLQMPSYLTSSALKIAAKIVDTHEQETCDNRLYTPNLRSNKTFQKFLYTDGHLEIMFKLHQMWERVRDNPDKFRRWFDDLDSVHDSLKLEMLPFFLGVILERRKESWFESIKVRAIELVSSLVNAKKEVSVQVLPVLMYEVARERSPAVKMACLRALPLMAKTKENVPTIVAILNKLRANKGVPTSFLIMLYTSLTETQVRCFPYLQELLAEPGAGRADDLRWEVDVARAMAVHRICETRSTPQGLELVSVISALLSKGGVAGGGGPAGVVFALRALRALWRCRAVAPLGAWRALQPRLAKDKRTAVKVGICELLSEIPSLRVSTPEYDELISDTARRLWSYIADSSHPEVVYAACDALAGYRIDDYKLKDVPEARRLWSYIADSSHPEVVYAACDALAGYRIDDYKLKVVPEVYRRTVKLPASYCKTPVDAARKPEDVLDYIPCEVWPEVFKYTSQSCLSGVQRLCTRLVERELRAYRSGVYTMAREAVDPSDLYYLPAASVVRGLYGTLKKQATSPSYDFPEPVLLSICEVLSSELPRPLPPLDLSWLHASFHVSAQWRRACIALAARQAQASVTARRFLENYLMTVVPNTTEESDILLVFELLPVLCRSMPPNTLRDPIQKCLSDSYAAIANVKNKNPNDLSYIEKDIRKSANESDGIIESINGEYLFIRQLELMRECLECEKIHDANRTLLSQIVENYFTALSDDNVAWPTYVRTSCCLSSLHLERMTSPSGWWEVTSDLLRKATTLRAAVCARLQGEAEQPLIWLNEVIDAHAQHPTEQEFSLRCLFLSLRGAPTDGPATRDWLLQLLARTQLAFAETEDELSKLYLCDVFMLSVTIFSGAWALEDCTQLIRRSVRQELLPASVAALLARPVWAECTLQMLEWLSWCASSGIEPATRASCQRALLALRHSPRFSQNKLWKRLDSNFGKTTSTLDD